MNFSNGNPEEDMSMEDILSSIRKYVTEESGKKEVHESAPEQRIAEEAKEQVISLDATHMVSDSEDAPTVTQTTVYEDPKTYHERSSLSMDVVNVSEPVISVKSKKPGPFEQLTNALNSYGKGKTEKVQQPSENSQTVDQLFTSIAEGIIQKWVNANMEGLVEKIVMREIEKIKSE